MTHERMNLKCSRPGVFSLFCVFVYFSFSGWLICFGSGQLAEMY